MSIPNFPTRKIGTDTVSAMGWGAMGLSGYYGSIASDEERLKFLDDLYETGCTMWDSANVYADSEDLIGKWFKRSGKRSEIFISTKVGIAHQPGRPSIGTPEYIKENAERSLKRFGVDQIDLYYLHRPDPQVPIEISVAAMAEFVKAGKIRYLGLSECTASTIRRAHAVHPITAIQVEYSLFALDVEQPGIDILKTARELGIAIVAYSPLGRGMLTGRFKSPDDFEKDDFRLTIPRFSHENFPKVLKIVDAVKAIAAKHNATPGQIALAWLLEQGEDIIPIPGTRSTKNLYENLGALKVKLSKEDIEQVRKIAEEAHNNLDTRYSLAGMNMVMIDTPPLESYKA
ncbi:NADP-dependent oxidoreductase domain-containing protein [Irpex rosettiformis]|uniref:NADP-dependent oxidoreductase domain-containing protein n=1 Tax=Irpex rosettiformis TaxID=378272 RepID=A0ACB8UDD3_9APHY|nr:NADP-dependent oxidoreductase domain-containing protein [Irpex rosettiformis]